MDISTGLLTMDWILGTCHRQTSSFPEFGLDLKLLLVKDRIHGACNLRQLLVLVIQTDENGVGSLLYVTVLCHSHCPYICVQPISLSIAQYTFFLWCAVLLKEGILLPFSALS